MKAAIFDELGNPVRVMTSPVTLTFMTACMYGETWRIVPDETTILTVPPIETLPIPPEISEPE